MKRVWHNKWFNVVISLAWMAFIFYLSSISKFPVKFQDPWASYISYGAHVFLYVFLTFFLARVYHTAGLPVKKAIVASFLTAIIFGALDEFHQSFVPYRAMDLKDWLVDVASALVVVYWYNYFYKLKMLK